MDCICKAVPLLKVLCDETRLHIMQRVNEKEMCANEILKGFSCSQPTLSYHMKILVEASLVCVRREGNMVKYRTNEAIWHHVDALLNALCKSQKGEIT